MPEFLKEGLVLVAGVLLAIFALLPLVNFVFKSVGLTKFAAATA